MTSNLSAFELARRVKRNLKRAEEDHPNCPHLRRMHIRLAQLAELIGPNHLDSDQMQTLSGTPKTPHPELDDTEDDGD